MICPPQQLRQVSEDLKKIWEEIEKTGLWEMLRAAGYPGWIDVIRGYQKKVEELIKSLNLPAERGFPPTPA